MFTNKQLQIKFSFFNKRTLRHIISCMYNQMCIIHTLRVKIYSGKQDILQCIFTTVSNVPRNTVVRIESNAHQPSARQPDIFHYLRPAFYSL